MQEFLRLIVQLSFWSLWVLKLIPCQALPMLPPRTDCRPDMAVARILMEDQSHYS